jgi:hypothetical protein
MPLRDSFISDAHLPSDWGFGKGSQASRFPRELAALGEARSLARGAFRLERLLSRHCVALMVLRATAATWPLHLFPQPLALYAVWAGLSARTERSSITAATRPSAVLRLISHCGHLAVKCIDPHLRVRSAVGARFSSPGKSNVEGRKGLLMAWCRR